MKYLNILIFIILINLISIISYEIPTIHPTAVVISEKKARSMDGDKKLFRLLEAHLNDFNQFSSDLTSFCQKQNIAKMECDIIHKSMERAGKRYLGLNQTEKARHILILAQEFSEKSMHEETLKQCFRALSFLPEGYWMVSETFMVLASSFLNRWDYSNALKMMREDHWSAHAVPKDSCVYSNHARGCDSNWGLSESGQKRSINYPYTARHRLRHDTQQIQYILDNYDEPYETKSEDDTYHISWTRKQLIESKRNYDSILRMVGSGPVGQGTEVARSDQLKLDDQQWKLIWHWYNKAAFVPHLPEIPQGVINPNLNVDEITQAFLNSDPNINFIDNLFRPEVIKMLLEYARAATIYYDIKAGYLGTYMRGGWSTPLHAQIVREVRDTFPDIFCSHTLVQAWSYKYDDMLEAGISTHGDIAAVNCNIWLAPDESALAPEQNGLVVYTIKPPADWEFELYNGPEGREHVNALLHQHNYKNITVAYKQNRALFFDSKLLHKSGKVLFKKGYKNRRINFTLLYGQNGDPCIPRNETMGTRIYGGAGLEFLNEPPLSTTSPSGSHVKIQQNTFQQPPKQQQSFQQTQPPKQQQQQQPKQQEQKKYVPPKETSVPTVVSKFPPYEYTPGEDISKRKPAPYIANNDEWVFDDSIVSIEEPIYDKNELMQLKSNWVPGLIHHTFPYLNRTVRGIVFEKSHAMSTIDSSGKRQYVSIPIILREGEYPDSFVYELANNYDIPNDQVTIIKRNVEKKLAEFNELSQLEKLYHLGMQMVEIEKRTDEDEKQRLLYDQCNRISYITVFEDSKYMIKDSETLEKALSVYYYACRLCDKMKAYDAAFAMHEHLKVLGPYKETFEGTAFSSTHPANPVNKLKKLGILPKIFTPETMSNYPRLLQATPSSIKPVFILGMTRTGSTLAAQILSMHPHVAAIGEDQEFPDIIRELDSQLTDYGKHWSSLLTENKLLELRQRYLNKIERLANEKFPNRQIIRIVDKEPSNYMTVPLLRFLFPESKIIHTKRNYLDNGVSLYFAQFKVNYAKNLDSIGASIALENKVMDYYRHVLHIPILEIYYEDSVYELEKQARRMIEFIGLQWHDDCINFHKSKRDVDTPSKEAVRTPLYKKAVDRWRNYAHLLWELKAHYYGKPYVKKVWETETF